MTDGPWGRFSSLLHFSPSPRASPNSRLCYVLNKITPRARTITRLNPWGTNLLIYVSKSQRIKVSQSSFRQVLSIDSFVPR